MTQFPKLHQISRKDLLGKNYAVMRKAFPQDYDFHPITFNLPEDRKKLTKMMIEEERGDFWLVTQNCQKLFTSNEQNKCN